MENNIKDKIEALTKEINEHNHRYYVLNNPTITDYEFDMMLHQLEKLEREYPEYIQPNSPTNRVGGKATSIRKIAHRKPMQSLTNTYDKMELCEFLERTKSRSYSVETKFDGISVSIIYEDGMLLRAVTRGDGHYGDDITTNVKCGIRSIPLETRRSFKGTIEVRGEIILPISEFIRINKFNKEHGKEPFANPRNCVSGTMKQRDPGIVAHRKPDCYIFGIDTSESDLEHPKTISESRQLLSELGFKIDPHAVIIQSSQKVMEYIDDFENIRQTLNYATDGMVIKVNDISEQEKLGSTAKSPRWATSYKYSPMSAETYLREVEWSVGRTGVITPVAIFDTVNISGTNVSRASLYNEDYIHQLGISIGDKISVEKGGEIIPKVTRVVEKCGVPECIEFPDRCPVCGSKVVREDGTSDNVCIGGYMCKPQICGKIEHFCSRGGANINIGEETISDMYEKLGTRTFLDLYKYNEKSFLKLDGFSDVSASNLYMSIQKSIGMSSDRLIYALGIPSVGASLANQLSKIYTIRELSEAKPHQLQNQKRVGHIIANTISSYFKEHPYIVNKLKEIGFDVDNKVVENETKRFDGLTFCITGSFDLNRRDIIRFLENNGGKFTSSISRSTNYVFVGENVGKSKSGAIEKFGIKTLDSSELEKLMAGEMELHHSDNEEA